jgi:hypothetical protein
MILSYRVISDIGGEFKKLVSDSLLSSGACSGACSIAVIFWI